MYIMTSHISTDLGMEPRRMDIHMFPVSVKNKTDEAESDDDDTELVEMEPGYEHFGVVKIE